MITDIPNTNKLKTRELKDQLQVRNLPPDILKNVILTRLLKAIHNAPVPSETTTAVAATSTIAVNMSLHGDPDNTTLTQL